ncbi:MAG: hypothetical protein R3204_12885 [Oceanospirillum sp.]|nr:hypothetical protein [Oceanospirillum sp.]MDX1399414.1 hypothetical protein [Oceanospirillum sp.]
MSRLRWLGAIVLAILVSGCGFQLRGTAGFPAELSPLYLSEQSSVFYNTLATQLTQGEVVLLKSKEGARWHLWLSQVRQQKQQTTFTSGSSSYDLYAEVDFQLRDADGKPVAPQTTLKASRTYTSSDSLYSEASDLASLRFEMERDLASRVARQLSRITLPVNKSTTGSQQP